MARLLVAEHGGLPLVQRDDASTELRLLSDQRDNLVAERTRLINQLHAQMLQIAPGYKEQSGRLTAKRGGQYCRDLQLPAASALIQTRLLIARQLADQVLQLFTAIATLTRELTRRVKVLGSPLRQLRGLGPVLIARLVGELGSTLRLSSAAALAALAGIAPITVASGASRGIGSIAAGIGSSTGPSISWPGVSGDGNPRPRPTMRKAGGRKDGAGRAPVSEPPPGGCGLPPAPATGAGGTADGGRARRVGDPPAAICR